MPDNQEQLNYSEYKMVMRSRATGGSDEEIIRVFEGEDVERVAERIADSYGAYVERLTAVEVDVPLPIVGTQHPKLSRFIDSINQEIADMHPNRVETQYLELIIYYTQHDAFVTSGRDNELSRIIKSAAQEIADMPPKAAIEGVLRDLNGNTVGLYGQSIATSTPPEDGVYLSIDIANFDIDRLEMARLLSVAANKILAGEKRFVLFDGRDNAVGVVDARALAITEEDSDSVDLLKSLQDNRVYLTDDYSLSSYDEEFCYVVPLSTFNVGYHEESGDVWVVNAKGEKSTDIEQPYHMKELSFRRLTTEEKDSLKASLTEDSSDAPGLG